MAIRIDSDVEAVAEFMTRHIEASKLVAVANSLSALAPSLWGQYEPERVEALRFVSPPISSERTQACASESRLAVGCADDGSAVEMGRHPH
jgi:hypothetical protein